MTDSRSQPTSEPVRQHTPTPWRVNTYSRDIYADNVLNGPMRIADIRGWGYLIGKGHGGLSDNDAMAVQAANAALIVEAVNSHASLKARVEELESTLKWIEARDRMWTAPEYEKGNEVLERASHNIKIRGPYGAAANLALKRAALPQSSGSARSPTNPEEK